MMTRFSTFTPRMWLILAHDLFATTAAVVASFFIRFEEAGLTERWRLLVILLPGFVVYSGRRRASTVRVSSASSSPRSTC